MPGNTGTKYTTVSDAELATLINSGNLSDARPLCVKNCEFHPENPDNWLILAAIDEQLRLDKGCHEFASYALMLDDKIAEAYLMLSRVSWKQGGIAQALELSEKAVSTDPELIEARLQIARQQLELDKPGDAIVHLSYGLQQEPCSTDLLRLHVLASLASADIENTVKFIKKLKRHSHDENLTVLLDGHLQRLLGNTDAAIKFFQQAMLMNSRDAEASYWFKYSTGNLQPADCEQRNRQGFESMAPLFHSDILSNRNEKVATILNALLNKHAGTASNQYHILDIGCGTGDIAHPLIPYSRSITGIDYSASMINIAGEQHLYDLLVCDEASICIPSLSKRFEIVTMIDVLPFSSISDRLIKSIQKVIKPGGLLLVTLSEVPVQQGQLPRFHYLNSEEEKTVSIFTSGNRWNLLERVDYLEHRIDAGPVNAILYLLQYGENSSEQIFSQKKSSLSARAKSSRIQGLEIFQQAITLISQSDYIAAKEKLDKAVNFHPAAIDASLQHGNVQLGMNRLDESIRCYERYLDLYPECYTGWFQLGVALQQKADNDRAENDRAIKCYQRAIELHPKLFTAYANLASLFKKQNLVGEVDELANKILSIDPDDSLNIISALTGKNSNQAPVKLVDGKFKVRQITKDNFSLLSNQAMAYFDLGRLDKSEALLLALDEYRPGSAELQVRLAHCLKKQGKHRLALARLENIKDISQMSIQIHEAKAGILAARGLAREAYIAWENASKSAPPDHTVHSNRLFMYNYSHQADRDRVAKAHISWGHALEEYTPIVHKQPPRESEPGSKLRIGYVSADFREHSVARFLLPLMRHHDHDKFEIYCYSNFIEEDSTTISMRYLADAWRNIYSDNDEQACSRIENDGIDILVDLSGHTGGNRLPLFARKPARLQMTYLGYPNTTGLSRIDYRIVDQWTDPVDQPADLHSEKLLRLPSSFLCYDPPKYAPAVQWLSAPGPNRFTFGCFNNLYKVTPSVIRVWSEILSRLPGSRLLLKSFSFESDETFHHYQDLFAENGISSDRIHLMSSLDSQDHYAMYKYVDIALDPFPYNGTTTTCEALWMGLPVIAKIGDRHAARVGLSILKNLGLEELAANSDEDYISLAVALASDQKKLARIKFSLRDRFRESILLNHSEFTRSLERLYENTWYNHN